jgi:ectoine hydroxylase-related dioxygenase (phytanoyl-CoA dioxygenase family)
MTTLTQEQLDFYSENGYLKYGSVLEPDELETLRREYDLEFEKAWKSDSYRNLSVSDDVSVDEKKKSNQKMFQIMQMCERNIHFRKTLFNSKILDVVEALMGPGIMLFHDQALFKPSKTGGPVPWHQDNGYWNCSPANLVSCWMTLDNAWKENGAMQVVPGSHLKPHRHAKTQESKALLELQVPDESKIVTVDLKAGECMFHHCQTLHYTQPNATEQQRRAFIIHFMVPGTRQGSGERMHPDFAHPILRMSI